MPGQMSPRKAAESTGEIPGRRLPEPNARRGSEPVPIQESDERTAARLPPAPRKAPSTTNINSTSTTAKSPPRSPRASLPQPPGGGGEPTVPERERGGSVPAPVTAAGRSKRASAVLPSTRAPPPASNRHSLSTGPSVRHLPLLSLVCVFVCVCVSPYVFLQLNAPPRRPPLTRASSFAPGKIVECVLDYAPADPTTELSACVGDSFEVIEVIDSAWLRVQHVDDPSIFGSLPIANCKLAV
jgi:hypothetical protein